MQNSKNIHVKIFRPDGLFYEMPATYIVFPDKEGQRAVFPEHISFVCLLGKGILKICKNDNTFDFFYLEEGLLENEKNKVVILSHTIIEHSVDS